MKAERENVMEWLQDDQQPTEHPSTGESVSPTSIPPTDDGAQTTGLRIVSRNDNPIPIRIKPFAAPRLRVVQETPEQPQEHAGFDLVTRLAGSWEQSFFTPGAPPCEHGQSPGIFKATDLATDPARKTSIPVDDPDVRVSPAPIPLFANYLASDPGSSHGTELDPAVSVRRAVLEIAREARRLGQTGGSEISFNLRLHPGHLGQIEVRIRRLNGSWPVTITTAHDEARDVLAAEIGRLEARLRRHRLKLDAVTVVTAESGDAAAAPRSAE